MMNGGAWVQLLWEPFDRLSDARGTTWTGSIIQSKYNSVLIKILILQLKIFL